MFTLDEIKKRVYMALERYSENGSVIPQNDLSIADIGARFYDAADHIQRKIAVCENRAGQGGTIPGRINDTTPGNTPLELDDFACDALVYGIASMLCPAGESVLYSRLSAQYEDCMRNLYNTRKPAEGIKDSMFGGGRKKLI